MGILNQSRLTAASKTFRAMFFAALEKGNADLQSLISLLAMEVTSTGDSEEYDWMGDVPSMEEWINDRPLQSLRANGFILKNKKFVNGLSVKRETLEDDKLGLVQPRIQTLAMKALQHKWELLLSLLNTGKSTLCYDGLYFFAENHSEGDSGSQANLTTDVFDVDAYFAACLRMRGLKNDKGKLLYMRPTHLLVCPTLEADAREILQASVNASGASNIWAGHTQLVVVDGLDINGDGNEKCWAVMDASKPVKPLIQQNREPVSFDAMDSADSPNVFMRDEFHYGAHYRGNAGYAYWQCIQASDGSGS